MVAKDETTPEATEHADSETATERRARQAVEGKAAMAEYRARRVAVDKRTAELRALRLARDQAERAANGKSGPRKRTGQEIGEEAGLFSPGPPVKYRVGI